MQNLCFFIFLICCFNVVHLQGSGSRNDGKQCGTITAAEESLIIGGQNAKRAMMPWHAGIYNKLSTPYQQICGGSLVTTTVVISAAHCFWTNRLEPASNYAVAVGKLYRPWNSPMDIEAQKSDVSNIKVPPRYNGALTNFQEDIALVFMSTAIKYNSNVGPVCLDFDTAFNKEQLREGNLGKVAGWGLTASGKASPVLKVVALPYVDIDRCIGESPPSFKEYITSDIICAGYKNGTALCKGDSGGGLVFPDVKRGTTRYYLRGVVSTAPSNQNVCNADAYTSFTEVSKYMEFINEYVLLE